jgi:hypothetical protein
MAMPHRRYPQYTSFCTLPERHCNNARAELFVEGGNQGLTVTLNFGARLIMTVSLENRGRPRLLATAM